MNPLQEGLFDGIKRKTAELVGTPCAFAECYPKDIRPMLLSDLQCLLKPEYEKLNISNIKKVRLLTDVIGNNINHIGERKYVTSKTREEIIETFDKFIQTMLTPLGQKVVNNFGIKYYIRAFQYKDKLPNNKRIPYGYDAIYALVDDQLLLMITPCREARKEPRI